MLDRFHIKHFSSVSLFVILGAFILILGLPLSLFLSQREQQLKQHAVASATIPTFSAAFVLGGTVGVLH